MMKRLQVETTNVCNGKCVFCPHDKIKDVGHMSDYLYKKILTNASQYDLEWFIPNGTGEPLLDPKIFERLEFARDCLPKTDIILFTNGSLLTKDKIDALRNPNIKLFISLNGVDRMTRFLMMGLDDFEHVVKMVDYAKKTGMLQYVSTVTHPIMDLKLKNFKRRWGAFYFWIRFNGFCGKIYKFRNSIKTTCFRALKTMTILKDGRAVLCCYDIFGEMTFGDLNKKSLEEIWNDKRHQHYLEVHKRKEGKLLPLCKDCIEPLEAWMD